MCNAASDWPETAEDDRQCLNSSCAVLAGPLHTAPSFSGGTVQTGLTFDAMEYQRPRSGAAVNSSGQAHGDLQPSKLQRHGSATHASSLEQVIANPGP